MPGREYASPWRPPSWSDVEDERLIEYVVGLEELPNLVVLDRSGLIDRRMVNYSIMLGLQQTDGFAEIARADCCDGEAHWHQYYERSGSRNDRTLLRNIGAPEDVYQTWDQAHDVIVQKWHERVRRWRSG